MAEADLFTTKAAEWSRRKPEPNEKWTDRPGDGFNAVYQPDEDLPLKLARYITLGTGNSIDEYHSERLNKAVIVKRAVSKSKGPLLMEEAKHLRHLNHHHIVHILGSYFMGPFFSIILEPVASCDLKTYLHKYDASKAPTQQDDHGMSTSLLPRFMGCLAHGLSYIHKEKLVRHRDLKPENILLQGTRVMFADFGLSKEITETQSGSSGYSDKTRMYTSPEREAKRYRNKSDDIFSLACVFSEIYTVYKGRTLKEFEEYRKKEDLNDDGYYHRVIEQVIDWLKSLTGTAAERCDVQFIRLVSDMFSLEPNARPLASSVWKALTSCTREVHNEEDRYFCGSCCMPLLKSDPLLSAENFSDPSETTYASSSPVKGQVQIINKNGSEAPFTTNIPVDVQVGLDWVRNVRHWNESVVDVVTHHKQSHHLVRKRAISNGGDVQWALAKNEAQILQTVHFKHIVSLFRTYKQGNVLTLLTEPAARYDLRSYLELAELRHQDLRFLTRSFGCLANTLAHLHKAGYDHGDIRRENILVHIENETPRIYLSKFSFGLKFKDIDTGRSRSIKERLIELVHGSRKEGGTDSTTDKNIGELFNNAATAQYRSPEWAPIKKGQPATDVFSLGCVFIEMYTILCGRKIRDFEKRRTDDRGTAFKYNKESTTEWLYELEKGKDYESKNEFLSALERMIDPDPTKRPEAAEVGAILQTCKSADRLERAGDCSIQFGEI